MKTTKELKIWSLRMVLFTILLSGLSVQKVYSFCNSTEIIINGKWYSNQEKVNTRSLPSIPIYNPQIEMFARFKMKSSFHKTKRII